MVRYRTFQLREEQDALGPALEREEAAVLIAVQVRLRARPRPIEGPHRPATRQKICTRQNKFPVLQRFTGNIYALREGHAGHAVRSLPVESHPIHPLLI